VDQHDGLGDALEVHCPVKCGVPAAHQENSFSFELPGVEHLEVEAPLFIEVLALDPELPGLERPNPRRNDDGSRRIVAGGRLQDEMFAIPVLCPPQAGHNLAEVSRRAKLQSLLSHVADQVLGQHLGKAGNVENVFLGVQRHELATQCRKRIDDAGRGAAHAGIEGGKQAGRASADD
jgi:hypothetical protein